MKSTSLSTSWKGWRAVILFLCPSASHTSSLPALGEHPRSSCSLEAHYIGRVNIWGLHGRVQAEPQSRTHVSPPGSSVTYLESHKSNRMNGWSVYSDNTPLTCKAPAVFPTWPIVLLLCQCCLQWLFVALDPIYHFQSWIPASRYILDQRLLLLPMSCVPDLQLCLGATVIPLWIMCATQGMCWNGRLLPADIILRAVPQWLPCPLSPTPATSRNWLEHAFFLFRYTQSEGVQLPFIIDYASRHTEVVTVA